jgi:serine/threonine protein kinase
MLQINPNKRPTAKQVLKHAWFSPNKLAIKELLKVNQKVASFKS